MYFEVICQLFLATFLGALIGLEREAKRKGAGFRTYSLVSLGTCLFTLLAFHLFNYFSLENSIAFDPSRIIQAIAIGIGFIGAGVIFHQASGVTGLTTAAGLWVVAAIGIAVGAKFYFLSVVGALFALFILVGLGFIEGKIFNKKRSEENERY